MNCYLIDDEQYAIDLLANYIGRLENLKVVGSNLNAKQALEDIQLLKNVDIVFTDIYMPKLSGFEVIRQLPKHIHSIVTTVNSHYLQEAQDLDVAGYLYKPFDFATFEKAINKLPKR